MQLLYTDHVGQCERGFMWTVKLCSCITDLQGISYTQIDCFSPHLSPIDSLLTCPACVQDICHWTFSKIQQIISTGMYHVQFFIDALPLKILSAMIFSKYSKAPLYMHGWSFSDQVFKLKREIHIDLFSTSINSLFKAVINKINILSFLTEQTYCFIYSAKVKIYF